MAFASRLIQAYGWRKERLLKAYRLVAARFWRRRLSNTVFVGITGSVGKTTTKDLAVAVLSRAGACSGNEMGLNYLDDIAKALLGFKRQNRFGVFEIATSGPGTIDERIALVKPAIGVMTIVGRDHIKAFGSMEAIAEEKAKLIRALPKDGVAVLNIDDPLIRLAGEGLPARCIWFGKAPEADLRVLEATSSYPDSLTLTLSYQGETHVCVTGVHGLHLTVPVLAAIGIGLAAGMRIEDCIAGLKGAPITPGRMQIVDCADGVTFVRDDFKAPHWSFQVALDYLRDARAVRKVAIIGTLSDYSLSASKLYPKVARAAREVADLVVFVGPHALRALKARDGQSDQSLVGFTDIEDAHRYLQDELRAGDLVLLKGSNRADHLVRLLIARRQHVGCWIRDCGWNIFCDDCPKLSEAHKPKVDPTTTDSVVPVVASGATTNAILVVGLGNPGEKYSGTLHNIGFDAVDLFAKHQVGEWEADDEGAACRLRIGESEIVLFKAATPMNLSGPAVEQVRQRLGVRRDRIVVVHDDADLELGRVRSKGSGSDGGHKGLRSLFAALGNDGFMPRVRVGVRVPTEGPSAARSIVLQNFSDEDQPLIQAGLQSAVEAMKVTIASLK